MLKQCKNPEDDNLNIEKGYGSCVSWWWDDEYSRQMK
jgi:hypothetical protein